MYSYILYILSYIVYDKKVLNVFILFIMKYINKL